MTTTTESTPTVCDCGHPPSKRDGALATIGTGYARDDEGQTYCYDCAEKREYADFAAAEVGARWFAYLALDGRTVNTWTGAKLARVTRRWETREGFGGQTLRIWAVDNLGRWWSGRGPVDSGTYVRLRLLKREPR